MEIKILGTVAPYCKDGKYCPGYFIKTKNEKILLDCGNGITNLLNMEEDLENMTIIISHFHPDHYGDLLSLAPVVDLYHKFGYLSHKVKLYLPKTKNEKIEERYTDADNWSASRMVEKPMIDERFIKNIGENHYFEVEEYSENYQIRVGNLNISFCKTLHPLDTYAVKVEDKTGVIVYSADTGYEEDHLVSFAWGADIFLCESSFLKGQMRQTNDHLYAHEAGKLAKKANVNQLILTHFWPEIDKNLYVAEAKEYFENTIAAEEGKVLTLTKIKMS